MARIDVTSMRFDSTAYLHYGDMDDDRFDFPHRHDIILVGTPDYVSERIEALRTRFGCQHLALFPTPRDSPTASFWTTSPSSGNG